MFQRTVRAPIQYSRRRPPGCGSGVGNWARSIGSVLAPAGRGSAAAAASTRATSRGERTRTVSPPIVQRKAAAPPPADRNARRSTPPDDDCTGSATGLGVDLVEQPVRVLELEVLLQVAGGRLAGGAVEGHLEREQASPLGSVGSRLDIWRPGRGRLGLGDERLVDVGLGRGL